MCDAYECTQNDALAEESANKLNSSFSSTLSVSSTGTESKQDRRRSKFDDTSCKKCSRFNPSVKIHAQGSHCQDCFLTYVHHKFRSTIGREGVIPYGTQVVLAYSGGPSSTAMLKLASDALKEKKKAKLSFTVHAVHVNLQHGHMFCTEKVLQQMSSVCESLGFDLTVVEASEWVKTHCSFSLSEFFKTDDETSKLDREKNLIQTILRQYSSQKKFHWLMTGQSLFRSAVCALTEVTFGRGCNLGRICKFLDERDPKVSIFYPMKEFTSKEIALFNYFNNLTSLKFSDLETAKSPNSSIQRLTEDFLLNLQVEFPAAAPNVRNSGEKMISRSTTGISRVQNETETSWVSSNNKQCGLCLMPLNIQALDPNKKENARLAAQFSDNLCGLANNQNSSSEPQKMEINICSFCKWDFNYD